MSVLFKQYILAQQIDFTSSLLRNNLLLLNIFILKQVHLKKKI